MFKLECGYKNANDSLNSRFFGLTDNSVKPYEQETEQTLISKIKDAVTLGNFTEMALLQSKLKEIIKKIDRSQFLEI